MKKCGIRCFSLIAAFVCMMALTGCGSGAQGAESNETSVTEPDAPAESGNTGEAAENAEPAEGSQPAENTEPAESNEPAENAETVEYSHEDIYLSLTIPDGWDYKVKTAEEMEKYDGLTICTVEFWPKAYPETVFTLSYETFFGICGTGVTQEEFAWESGISGWRYTEEIEDTLWLTMTFINPQDDTRDGEKLSGTYCLMASPKLAVWDEIQPEFEEIVESIWVGLR